VERFFASGHAVDLVIGVLVIEAAWLIARRNPPVDVLAMLMPAALILLGLRAALTGMAWPWIATPLALAFPAHLFDLRRRLGRR
jgi:hypothetical protein